MMQEEAPYQFSDLAGLLQDTHESCYEIVKSCAGNGNESRWEEVENLFTRMFKMVANQVPLIQIKFQAKLDDCRQSRAKLQEKIKQLTEELQLCNAKLQLQNVKPVANANDAELEAENETLRAEVIKFQRNISTLQSQLNKANEKLTQYKTLDDDCSAQIIDLTSENRELKQTVEQLKDYITQLREGSVVQNTSDA